MSHRCQIVIKSLSNRVSERYQTSQILAEELDALLTASAGKQLGSADQSTVRTTRITPRGLRAFESSDVGFFHHLIPGPRDGAGLPDALGFWRIRIDETDSNNTFPIGLLYGPSGCGKSSLVKAGLLPIIGDHVYSIYVDASVVNVEHSIVSSVRNRFSDLPQHASLTESLLSS